MVCRARHIIPVQFVNQWEKVCSDNTTVTTKYEVLYLQYSIALLLIPANCALSIVLVIIVVWREKCLLSASDIKRNVLVVNTGQGGLAIGGGVGGVVVARAVAGPGTAETWSHSTGYILTVIRHDMSTAAIYNS